MLGSERKCMTKIASIWVFIERHLASWERFLAESQRDLRGVSPMLVMWSVEQLGAISPCPMRCRWHTMAFSFDELPECRRHVLEVLRQPLEDGVI